MDLTEPFQRRGLDGCDIFETIVSCVWGLFDNKPIQALLSYPFELASMQFDCINVGSFSSLQIGGW